MEPHYQCYCHCHRSYDSCPEGGKCCQNMRERVDREDAFWESKVGQKIQAKAMAETIEILYGYKVKLTKGRGRKK